MNCYNGSEFDRKRLQSRVQYYIDNATLWQKQQGCSWYWQAHRYAVHLSRMYGFTLHQTAAVISILSPGTRWSINMRDAEAYCKAARDGDEQPSATTYGPQQAKAWGVLNLDRKRACSLSAYDYEDYIGTEYAKKTKAFYWNMLDPTAKDVVTIDRWVLRALGLNRDHLSIRQYDAVVEAIRDVARKYKTQAHKVQATIWLAVQDEWEEQEETVPF